MVDTVGHSTRSGARDELVELGADYTPAITCAEAVYWRSHRRIVADWLVARGRDVVDIFGPDRANDHEHTEFAVADDGRVLTAKPDRFRPHVFEDL